MAIDRYAGWSQPLVVTGRSAFAITPADFDQDFAEIPLAIYVGTAGHIVGILIDDTEETIFLNVPQGTGFGYRFRRILTESSGSPSVATTAGGLVGVFQ